MLLSAPVRQVAKRLGCRVDWLIDVCAREKVPIPDGDYWRRKRAGKRAWARSARQPLSKPMLEVGEAGVRHLALCDSDYLIREPAPLPADATNAMQRIATVMPAPTESDHPLVARAQAERRMRSRRPRTPLLATATSEDLQDRADDVLSKLLHVLARVGASFSEREPTPLPPDGIYLRSWDWGRAGPSRLVVDLLGEKWSFGVLEERTFKKVRPNNHTLLYHLDESQTQLESTGTLCLELRTDQGRLLRKWCDSKVRRIEERVDRIGRDLVRLVPILRSKAVEEERMKREREASEERRRTAAAQAELDEQRRTWLTKLADSWSLQQRIRTFVAVAEARASDEGLAESDRAWLRWASDWADSLDPFRAGVAGVAAQFEGLTHRMRERHRVDVE